MKLSPDRAARTICEELLITPRILARDRDRLTHVSVTFQNFLDLAEFDAVTADLYLLVRAPDEFNASRFPGNGRDPLSCTNERPVCR